MCIYLEGITQQRGTLSIVIRKIGISTKSSLRIPIKLIIQVYGYLKLILLSWQRSRGGHLAVYIAVKVILSLHGDTFITSFVGNGPDDWSPEA